MLIKIYVEVSILCSSSRA